MLSILIPTKDYNCSRLVTSLHKQGEELDTPFEILIAEDGSSPKGIMLNKQLALLPNCRIIIIEKNMGRASVRNLLAKEAQYPNILFIDSDAIVEKDNFLKKYCEALSCNDVVCGGLYHAQEQPTNDCSLRYRYEKRADKRRSAAQRSLSPYDNFTTFNFAIRREVFLSTLFNEKITRYGYEDTLFGHNLRDKGIKIKHIDNALLHTGLESNSVYLGKIEESIRTLIEIRDEINETPLLRAAGKLEKAHCTRVVSGLWEITNKTLKKNLLGERPSLMILNIYKLGFFCYLLARSQK